MCITAYCELDIVRYSNLDHCGFVVYDLHNGDDNLVHELLVYFLSVLETLDHVVDELLRHLVLDLDAVVVGLDGDSVEVEALGSGGLITNFYGGVEIKLSHDLLALG